jgi:predicted Zn-dependent peptidase
VIDRKLNDYEADVMHFLNHILTGTTFSRIYGAARKKGLAYGVFSDSTLNERDSSWDFGGQVNLETADALFDIIVRELKNTLSGDITEDEIEIAKQYTLGRYQMGAQTVAQISNFYAGRYFSDDFVRDYEGFPGEITKVKAKDIVGLANEFVTGGTWALAGVGSAEKELITGLHEKFATIFED